MRIVILGAGQVGATLAEKLSGESNDITLVDTNAQRLRALQDRLDIRTVTGQASFPSVLTQAGSMDADMMVAVTSSDEINMLACQLAQTLFNIPRKVARIRHDNYLKYADQLYKAEAIPVDVLISPEQLITDHIEQLTRWPGALQIHDFMGSFVKLAVYRIEAGFGLCDHRLSDLDEMLPGIDIRVVALYRGDAHVPLGNSVIFKPQDEVYIIATPAHLEVITRLFVSRHQRYRKIMIAGGGNIGASLAARMQKRFHVKVIEANPERCREITEKLDKAIVINGSVSELDILTEEGIDQIDLFCALTNDDEANVMSSLLAKRAGARQVLTIINNPAYVDLVDGDIINYAISPEHITTGSLLAYIRKGDVIRVHSLRKGQAEALETVVHGDIKTSRIAGRQVSELELPADVRIGAIVRDNRVIMSHADTRIENEDHLIFFITSKKSLKQIEKLLQVGFSYF